MSVAAPERRELVQALLAWLAAVRLSAGFVSGHVAEDLEVLGAYMFTAAWHSREDMDAHMVGPDFGALLGALEVLGHDTHLMLTAADGAEDGWGHVRELRSRPRPIQEEGAPVPQPHPVQPPGAAPA